MKTKSQGFYWHLHHDKLIEWCYDYQERVDAINQKPKNEIETRLRLFKPVKGKLPKKLNEAEKKWVEAEKKWVEARKKWVEARKKRYEAWNKWVEAREKLGEASKKYLPELELLHKKECGCKEWNGKELVFK